MSARGTLVPNPTGVGTTEKAWFDHGKKEKRKKGADMWGGVQLKRQEERGGVAKSFSKRETRGIFPSTMHSGGYQGVYLSVNYESKQTAESFTTGRKNEKIASNPREGPKLKKKTISGNSWKGTRWGGGPKKSGGKKGLRSKPDKKKKE